MSREIKLKTINLVTKKVETFEIDNNFDCNVGWLDDKVIVQYTGFKDIDGKEIYDGDILSDKTECDGEIVESRCQVYFDETLGEWTLDNSFEQDKTFSISLYAELNDFDYKIIGNIFEK